MKRILMILFGLSFSLILIACSEQVNLSEIDKNYVIQPTEIQMFNSKEYEVLPMKNGKEYFFTKSKNSYGASSLYSITLLSKSGKEVTLKASIAYQEKEKDAEELYDSFARTYSIAFKEDILSINPKEYNAEKLFLAISKESYCLVLKRSKVCYSLTIDGASIDEEPVKDIVLKKVDYLLKNGMPI